MHDPRDDSELSLDAFAGHAVLRTLQAGGEAQLHIVRLRAAVDGHVLGVLKRLPPERLADAHARARLIAEGRLGARLRAPQLVRTLSYGVDDGYDHEPFVVLELVDGPHLAALVAYGMRSRDPLPLALRVFILTEVARGLHALHIAPHADDSAPGVVHRDVSPQNILVDVDGSAKLADLGLALPLHAAGPRKRAAGTAASPPAGSVGYMAPEQRRGERVDGRADLFALGVVGLELLLGRRLLTAQRGPLLAEGRGLVPDDVLSAARHAEPELGAVLATLVAAAPDERASDAGAVVHALLEWQARRRGPAGRDALAAWMQRHSAALSLRTAVAERP